MESKSLSFAHWLRLLEEACPELIPDDLWEKGHSLLSELKRDMPAFLALVRKHKNVVDKLIEDILTLDGRDEIHARLSLTEPVIVALYCERYLLARSFLESLPRDDGVESQCNYTATLRKLLLGVGI